MVGLELLAPAKTADIGIEAIRHGADAVYIGAPRFGARAAAGNCVDDIARLVGYAHQFGAKVYVTVNTLLKDEELTEVEALLKELDAIHVDAIIVQDPKVLSLTSNLSSLTLRKHASTQMDNRTPEQVRALVDAGFEQVVLTRELTIDQIREIHEQVPEARLEVFVHGALCVCYSGRCFASEVCFGRSANRGECAQMCRMEYELLGVEDTPHNRPLNSTCKKLLWRDKSLFVASRSTFSASCPLELHLDSPSKKHYLSLKDLCLIDHLEELIDAGAVSFKIEGRLKDMSYVKNVTAAYNEALNHIVTKHPERYHRASRGRVDLKFKPDVRKSFNRGFTTYFLHGRQPDIWSFDTPKAMGEPVGRVKDMDRKSFTVAGLARFANGDGLCFINAEGELQGFRINKVVEGHLYPLDMPKDLCKGTPLYRNYDKAFEDILQGESADRYVEVDVKMTETVEGFSLKMSDDYGTETVVDVQCEKELARSHQSENIRRQLSRLGGTNLRLRTLTLDYDKNWFIPSSLLSQWRRMLVTEFSSAECRVQGADLEAPAPHSSLELPLNSPSTPFELPFKELMTCKHCLKYALGLCGKPTPPLGLRLANGMEFALEFDCRRCEMLVRGLDG